MVLSVHTYMYMHTHTHDLCQFLWSSWPTCICTGAQLSYCYMLLSVISQSLMNNVIAQYMCTNLHLVQLRQDSMDRQLHTTGMMHKFIAIRTPEKS